MSDEPPFPEDKIPKDGWTRYDMPVKQDDKWVVRVTDIRKPDWEKLVSFDTEEEGKTYVKERTIGKLLEMVGKQTDKMPTTPKPKRQGNYVNANYRIIELTDEQKKLAREWFTSLDKTDHPEDLKAATQRIFDNPNINGHHTEAKSLKAYIATLAPDGTEIPKIKTTQKIAKGEIQLDQVQVDQIISLINSPEPPPITEIVKLVFPELANKAVVPASREYKAVYYVIRDYNANSVDIWDEPVVERRYRPPSSYNAIIGLVNKHVNNPVDPRRALYDPANIKPSHEKNLKALLSFMKTTKFVLQASEYDKRAARDLFESTFIRHVQDKAADLTPEEVDTYVTIAAGMVKEALVERQITREEGVVNQCLDSSDENKVKLSMSLVESLKSLRGERKQLKDHNHKLITSIAGSRSKRLENKSNKDDYLANLIEAWRDEEKRIQLIELAKKEHSEDANEFKRIQTLDQSFALIAGMTEEEATKGY